MLHEDVAEGRLGEIQFVRARAHFACWSHVIDQVLWTMGMPEWVSVLGDPNKPGGWHRLIHMKWANGVDGELTGADSWGWYEDPLSVMVVGDKFMLINAMLDFDEQAAITYHYNKRKLTKCL